MRRLLILLTLALTVPVVAWESVAASAELPTAATVLADIDKNMTFESRTMDIKMTSINPRRTRAFTMNIQSRGKDQAAIEYVDPPREAGTKMLRVGDELWMYMPSVEKTQKISGHMLRQGMMGTDVSYEDMMAAGDLASVYDAVVTGVEDCGVDSHGVLTTGPSGRQCWKMELTAKDATVSYPKRTCWIDTEYSIAVRQELYAVSGMLLKSWTMGDIQKFDARWFPTRMAITDKLQEGTSTTLEFSKLTFGVAVADEVFSTRWLERGGS